MYIPSYFSMYQMVQTQNKNIDKKIILEPLSTILRLIIFIYKEKGTKISIYNNAIYYNEPNYFQGFIRNFNGDKREDLHNIYYPILKSFEWYDYHDPIYKYFYEKCIDGLRVLSQCYDKDSIIHHTLIHYISTLQDVLNGKEINLDDGIKQSPLLDDFKILWKREELEIVYRTLSLLELSRDDERPTFLKTIDDIVSMKEKRVKEYIDKFSTSYN